MLLTFTKHARERLFERANGVRIADVYNAFNAGECVINTIKHTDEVSIDFPSLRIRLKCVRVHYRGETGYTIRTVGDWEGQPEYSPKRRKRDKANLKKKNKRSSTYIKGKKRWN